MRVLIIGGTGLISTEITRQLLARGDEVTHFNRGKTPNRAGEGARVISGDRKQYAEFEARMADSRWDAVIDMIGFVPEDAASLIRAFEGRAKHVVFCSTVCVYGGPLSRLPATEEEPRTPVSTYGANKGACEDALLAAYRQSGFPVTIIRPSHTYGEGGGIVHSLGACTQYIDRIRRGLPVVVHGDGSSLWASCHISDVARAFVNSLGNARCFGEAYHVTGETWMNWNEYAEGVAEAVGGTAVPVHIPTDLLVKLAPTETGMTRDIFQYHSVFNNAKAREHLGFSQQVPWIEGVRRTVAWLDEQGRVEQSTEEDLDSRIISAWQRLSDSMAV